jgi:hypothetical protein
LRCKGNLYYWNLQTFYLFLIPNPKNSAIKSHFIPIKSYSSGSFGYYTVVYVICTVAFAAMQIQAIILPGKGVSPAALLLQTVRALALIGHQHIIVTAHANDNAVVSA